MNKTKENMYRLDKIYWAYTENGKVVAPFILNNEKTKCKNILLDSIYDISEEAQTRRSNEEKLKNTLNFFSKDKNHIKVLNTKDMLMKYTEGANIKGAIFIPLNIELFLNQGKADSRFELRGFRRESLHMFLPSTYATPSQLKPLINQLQKSLKQEFELTKKFEAELETPEDVYEF